MILQWASKLASLKFTLVVIVLVGLGVIVSYRSEGVTTWTLAIPLFLFSLNVFAAILTNPVFRRQMPLLMFHLALVAIVLLIAVGRLSYMRGFTELAVGETFSAEAAEVDQGPWHWSRLDRVSFTNEGFEIDYAAGVKLTKTLNSISWRDEDGKEKRGTIGDMTPLTLYGYSFYTSHKNKGYAPTFIWRPDGGTPVIGTVHLPAYPRHEYRQAMTWAPPGSKTSVWVMLQFDDVILSHDKESEFRLPSQHTLVVRTGDVRHQLKPGESVRLPDGLLEYNGLRTWLGYTIFYDFTLPWLLAAGLLAVGSITAYFWRKFSLQPWNR